MLFFRVKQKVMLYFAKWKQIKEKMVENTKYSIYLSIE